MNLAYHRKQFSASAKHSISMSFRFKIVAKIRFTHVRVALSGYRNFSQLELGKGL